MTTSSIVIDKAQQLAAAGHHAEVVALLGAQDGNELEGSPSLALLYGTAHARMGRHDEGRRWLDVALDQARKRNEQAIEGRALNARGAVALVGGRIDEAADFCTRGLMVASRDSDVATAGRCSTNLGIISHLRGRHAEAIASWEIARAAFDRAGWRQGIAQCQHNLAITYREQGAFDRALMEADRAVAEAQASGDHTLWALALRGRAEIRVVRGELQLARGELDRVYEIRRSVPDPADEAEDLRTMAMVLAAEGEADAAESALRDVIARADGHRRPQLLAEATRDLALVLRRSGRNAEAQEAARTAQAIFARLGAEAEIRNLASQEWDGDFAAELGRSLAPLHTAQALADAGDYAELVTYLGGRTQDELEQSPMLALLSGIGHAAADRADLVERAPRQTNLALRHADFCATSERQGPQRLIPGRLPFRHGPVRLRQRAVERALVPIREPQVVMALRHARPPARPIEGGKSDVPRRDGLRVPAPQVADDPQIGGATAGGTHVAVAAGHHEGPRAVVRGLVEPPAHQRHGAARVEGAALDRRLLAPARLVQRHIQPPQPLRVAPHARMGGPVQQSEVR